jgi:uncharacterized protein
MVAEKAVLIRFYEELNDFLPRDKRKKEFHQPFRGNPSIKDLIENLGVPHPEIDLILVNGRSVDFSYRVQSGDRISVYPVFELLDISPLLRLRPAPLRHCTFILDVNLGKLARKLRMLGFDSLYRNDFDDQTIIRLAQQQKRTILTRDVGLLKNSAVQRGYWIRSTQPKEQIVEVVRKFDLFSSINPFTLCLDCNGPIKAVKKEMVWEALLPRTKESFDNFYRCENCGKVYWPGSHFQKMQRTINWIKEQNTG